MYIILVKKTIKEFAKEFENNDEVDAPLLWDTMKMHIRSRSLNYGRKRKRDMKSEETSIESDILFLQSKLEENNPPENTKNESPKRIRGKNNGKIRNCRVQNLWGNITTQIPLVR